MRISILAIGKVKEPYLRAGISEYEKRLRAYGKLKIVEIKDEPYKDPISTARQEEIKRAEGERLLAGLTPNTYVIALDPQGEVFSSPELAQKINNLLIGGKGHMTFIIGGSLGLGDNVKIRSDLLLSFSQLTFPHQLFRLILLEQIYRLATLLKGEPYHR